MSVVIETTIGDITVDLYTKERPRCCLNFLKLCKMKYYNLTLFHSVQRGFIAQTGDPTGTGRGGDSLFGILYGEQARYFEAEKVPKIKHSKIGTLSMVNCGDNMLGSQFFLTLGQNINYLDDEHCPFGEVVEGLDVLVKLNETICDDEKRPYQDIRITHTVILDDPYDDPDRMEVPSRSPSPSKEMLDSDRIGADEAINDMEGLTMEEMDEIIQEKEAKARATILEMVGDLPEADVAPPENVLFVCKLNPVTTDEDLEIIFSRFGKIICCEVIRDQKSGDSLQYAFIEFDERKSCEDAYFKMDNVLIDDRRIHVDFSQSVSKYRWKGKGRGVEVKPDEEKGNKPNKPSAPWVQSNERYFAGSSGPSGDKKNDEGREERNFKRGRRDDRHREERNPERRNERRPERREFNERKRNDEPRRYRDEPRGRNEPRDYKHSYRRDERTERTTHHRHEEKKYPSNPRDKRGKERNRSPGKATKDSNVEVNKKAMEEKSIDQKLLELLKKDLEKKEGKKRQRDSSSSSDSSSDSSSSSSDSSPSHKKSHGKSRSKSSLKVRR